MTSPGTHSRSRRYRVVAALFILSLITDIDRAAISTAKGPMATELSLCDGQVGAVDQGRKKNFTPSKRKITDRTPHATPQNQYGRNNAAAITATSDGIGPATVSAVRVNR